MADDKERGEESVRRRSIGEYVLSGDWSDYWTTRISRAEGGRIRVRGYRRGTHRISPIPNRLSVAGAK